MLAVINTPHEEKPVALGEVEEPILRRMRLWSRLRPSR